MLIHEHGQSPAVGAIGIDDLLHEFVARIELLSFFVSWVIAVFADESHTLQTGRDRFPIVAFSGMPCRAASARPMSVAGVCSICMAAISNPDVAACLPSRPRSMLPINTSA